MINITVRYYAQLRDERGCAEETLACASGSAAGLYDDLQREHGFSLDRQNLKVAIDDEFCDWSMELREGHRVVFIPPVAGGT